MPRPKSIGDINRQAGELLARNNATASRTRRINAIADAYNENIRKVLGTTIGWPQRANIKMSYGTRIGDPLERFAGAETKSKGNSVK